MIKFISNIWDKYLKATGKRPYTEDELTEGSRYPALKELLNFVKFVNALGFR